MINKNKNVDINTTIDIMMQLSLFPVENRGKIQYIKDKITCQIGQYPIIYQNMLLYFINNN